MRWIDAWGLAYEALRRHKLRTVLTLLGVVAGTLALVASLSLGAGVQQTIVREYSKHHELRRIEVVPDLARARAADPLVVSPPLAGTMSDERRKRLQEERQRRVPVQQTAPVNVLTRASLRELERLPHVRSVTPDTHFWGARGGIHESLRQLDRVTGPSTDADLLKQAIVAGQGFANDAATGVLVSEYLLYQEGIVNEADVAGVIGKKLRLEIVRGSRVSPRTLLHLLNVNLPELSTEEEETLLEILKALPNALERIELAEDRKQFLRDLLDGSAAVFDQETRVTEEYVIQGVFRTLPTHQDFRRDLKFHYVDVILPKGAAEALHQRLPENFQQGFNRVTVETDDVANVRPTVAAIEAMDYKAYSLLQQVEVEQFTYGVIFAGMTLVAILAFLVAGLSITNVMLMSVLERTREIGIMKAVGANPRQVAMLFLIEGMLLGLIGGAVGLLLARLGAIPGDAWVRAMLAQRTEIKLTESIFAFPYWLVMGAPAFAALVTTVAAWPPARRAARVFSVEALREPG